MAITVAEEERREGVRRCRKRFTPSRTSHQVGGNGGKARPIGKLRRTLASSGSVLVEQCAIAASHKVEAGAYPAHHDVAQRHRLPRNRDVALCAEHVLSDVLICGACPSTIDRPEHFDEMALALGGEAIVRCRPMMNESVPEAVQRVDAITKKRIDGREDGYGAARCFAVERNGSEALTGEDEAEIEAFLSRSGTDRIDGDRCRNQAGYDYRRQNDCGRIDSGAPEDVGVRGGQVRRYRESATPSARSAPLRLDHPMDPRPRLPFGSRNCAGEIPKRVQPRSGLSDIDIFFRRPANSPAPPCRFPPRLRAVGPHVHGRSRQS